ncbi:MAG TPA: protein kinase [Candidatus Eisenbacteria bacterium]
MTSTTVPKPLVRALADRYRVERELGRGGMAAVYLADDLKHGRKVAIKVLRPDLAAAIGHERFLREIEIAARLAHPHILPLYDSGAAGGSLYYVTPYIPGGSLRARLEREKQLPLEDALRIAREIASALGHAHRQGLVHRDIKPENVLLSEGIALVADFGVARAVSEAGTRRLTTASTSVGTPCYMAPEQAMGNADVDGRADLYALGCLLYEMLAGQPPFTGPEESLAYQHLSVAPRPVTELRPTVPKGVAATITKALAKLPSDRHATAARFAEALASAVTEGVTSAPEPERAGAAIPNNLPKPRTRFIGRERELAECARLMGESRVLTITGIGGCGKTRLALRLSETLLDAFPDGVWYADQAPIKEADRVPLTLATALGVRQEPQKSLLETLTERLRDQHALIVLDNCEHVLSAAAELTDAMVAVSTDLKVIVTSREGLGIDGERLLALRSLSVPAASTGTDLKAVEASEAGRLFVDRGQGVDARFALTEKTAPAVAEICRRLDGIPLALELAAARIKVLKVEEIAARLVDRFRLLTGGSRTALPRHQTLRSTIQWSYDQLTEPERRLFRLLSVFAGGWTLEAATRVGDADDEFEVLDLMTRLVDKSLVAMESESEGSSRYAMLETMRQYAQERLNESGEGHSARERHLQFYLALAEQAEPNLRGPEQASWLTRLLQEQENLLAAHAWCERAQFSREGLRLVGALRRYWIFLGLHDLGRRVTTEALARPGASDGSAARAKALCAASHVAFFMGSYQEGRDRAEESLSIARHLGGEEAACDALGALGVSCYGLGEAETAKSHLNELIVRARALGDRSRLSVGLNDLAEVLRAEGDLDGAAPLYEEFLAITRDMGNRDNTVIGLQNLAMVAISRGAMDRAGKLLIEAISMVNPRSVQTIGDLTDCVSTWCAAQGKWIMAARLHGAAEAQLLKTGSRREPADEDIVAPFMERTRQALGEAAFDDAAAEGRAMGAELALAQARAHLE